MGNMGQGPRLHFLFTKTTKIKQTLLLTVRDINLMIFLSALVNQFLKRFSEF